MIRTNLKAEKAGQSQNPKWGWTMRTIFMTSAASLALGAALFSTACSFRTPSTETPIPESENTASQGIAKTFFEDVVTENVLVKPAVRNSKGQEIEVAKYEKRSVRRPKTFLCGWAPINENGAIAHQMLTNSVHMSGHCNIEFEVTEDNLIGRLINPSFPADRNRWKQILVIPIEKHFYLEKSKDGYGRDTNELVENGSRSDWSSRPHMKLNLAGMRILDEGMGFFWDSRTGAVTKVSDVEWDKEKGFLGFTLDTTSPVYGADYQARFRVNFLRFEHNPDFKRTPFNSTNARHLNALHILGEKVDGLSPILYAAHWDLNKKHKVYLHGFPPEHIPIAQAVVDAWNKVFTEKLKLPAAFELDLSPVNKYGFDLRYPTMTWISDPLISAYSPLGIGTALADVKNGEILWGNVTLYGGMIERYIKAFLPGEASGSASGKVASPIQIPQLGVGFFTPPVSLQAPPDFYQSLDPKAAASSGIADRLHDILFEKALSKSPEWSRVYTKFHGLFRDIPNLTLEKALEKLSSEEKATLTEVQNTKQQLRSHADTQAAAVFAKANEEKGKAVLKTQAYFSEKKFSDVLDFKTADISAAKKLLGDEVAGMSRKEATNAFLRQAGENLRKGSGAVVFDTDRRFIDVAPGWAMARQLNEGATYESALKVVVKELVIHEFGHFLGLGHQFKENILPEEGDVPEKVVAEHKLREKAAKNMTNSTSVMGYKSPVTEMLEHVDEVAPGPQDELVLRYLYKQEYATYRKGDSDFTFFPVPKNGVIPTETDAKSESEAKYKVAYFPQCNDFQASTASDPYCNRFDRGYNAQTIVDSYFEELDANKITRLYAFTDARGGNTEYAEAALWSKALTIMGRIRLFYDHMRQQFAEQLESLASDPKDLYQFSQVCAGEATGSPKLHDMIWTGRGSDRKLTRLGELCAVNRRAVKGFLNFMINPGPDHSRMDWNNNYLSASMTGGDAELDSSRAFGTHSALSVLPLKLSALNALTTPLPYFFWGPWMLPVPRFSEDQGRFSYSTFYPFEFTQAMAAAAEKNLTMPSLDRSEKPRMGVGVLSMGYFLSQLSDSHDLKRFPRDYTEKIANQSNFRLSLVVLVMNMRDNNGDRRVTHFETEIFDFRNKDPITGVEAYILPGGKVIARAPGRSFVYPITDFAFLNDKTGYVLAYRAEYDEKHDDLLASHSVKKSFETLHNQALDACINGQNNGLSSFFNSKKQNGFEGFEALEGIGTGKDAELYLRFLESVEKNFETYHKTMKANKAVCENSRESLAAIISSAAILNNFWVPEAKSFIW